VTDVGTVLVAYASRSEDAQGDAYLCALSPDLSSLAEPTAVLSQPGQAERPLSISSYGSGVLLVAESHEDQRHRTASLHVSEGVELAAEWTALAPHLSSFELRGPVVTLRTPRGVLLLITRENAGTAVDPEDGGTAPSPGDVETVLDALLLPEP
jgi:hypothetical protein